MFSQRPAGTGDLVVRGQIETDLVSNTEDADRRGLLFEALVNGEAVGGVTIGGVIGVDANGRRAGCCFRRRWSNTNS